MRHKVGTRLLACLLAFCLLGQTTLPVAAQAAEQAALSAAPAPVAADPLPEFEDVPVGDANPAPDEDAVSEPQTPDGDAVTDPQTPDEDAVTDPQTPDGDAVTDPQTPDGDAVSEPQTPDEDAVTEPQTPDEDAVSDPQTPDGDTAAGQEDTTEKGQEISTNETAAAISLLADLGEVSLEKYNTSKEIGYEGEFTHYTGENIPTYWLVYYEIPKAMYQLLNPIYKDENGVEYIVITNAAQLMAIGTDKPVVGGWVTFSSDKWDVEGLAHHYWTNITSTIHGGDMDATSLEEIGVLPEDFDKATSDGYGNWFSISDGIGDTGKTYSADANYLIANDIDLDGLEWTPWDYSGKIIRGDVSLTDGTSRNPVISNIKVVEGVDPATGKVNNVRGTSQRGVGFFGAVFSPSSAADVEPEKDDHPWWDIIGNLLQGLIGLVVGLFKTLGGLVTDVIGAIAGWEDITTLTMDSVTIEGLTLRNVTLETDGLYQTQDSNGGKVDNPMPVGGFAGQASGDVTIRNCHVEELQSVSGQEQVGGFVGKTVGATEYLLHGTTSGLADTLEGLGGVLDSVLGFLLPTDDLVTGLIEKLGLRNLVPTRYKPAVLENCSTAMAGGAAITAVADYAGGFAGKVQGTTLTDCQVSQVASVTGSANVGGFAGRIANAYVLGLLQGLGVNLVNFPVSSKVTNCTVSGSNLKVTSTVTDVEGTTENALAYAGGFAGAVMASNVLYDGAEGKTCGVDGLAEVTARGSYVGGFAGYAGVGDVAEALNLLSDLLDLDLNLKTGEDGIIEVPLGTTLTDLLDTLLGVNINAGLLSLIGLNAAQLVGCSVAGDGYTVTSESGTRVGGFVGYLHGGQVLEQPVEKRYARMQATDQNGNLLYVNLEAVTTNSDGNLTPSGAVYARLQDGTVVYEDVHGQTVEVTPVTPAANDTVYNVYDTVYMASGTLDQYTPALMSTFRDEEWNAVTDAEGNPISNAEKLNGYPNIVIPVYQQRTNGDGYVQFTYHYMEKEDGEDVAKQRVLYRKDGKYYTLDENGVYQSFGDVDTDKLSVEAVQVAVEDSMQDTASGTIVTTYINGLAEVKGVDYVGGVAGQAKLCSATDLLSNLTVVQYERFELNNVRLVGAATGYTVTATNGRAGGAVGYAMGGDVVNVKVSNLRSVQATSYAGGFAGEIIPGTVAGQDGSGLKLLGLVSVSNLLTVVNAVHTFVNDSAVTGVGDGFALTACNEEKNAAAGGFAGWSINSQFTGCTVAKLARVQGDGYAGGFCAVADTGSIAGVLDDTFGGVDLTSLLGLNGVLSLLQTFPNRFTNCTVNTGDGALAYTVSAVPEDASSTPGERINAQNRAAVNGASCGSAGGFLGYGTAVQVENCANENLQAVDATSYAGGFGGYVTIGSVAQLGNAGLLGKVAGLTGIAALLDCAVSIIKSSHCQGTSGGYTVTAFDRVVADPTPESWNDEGMAGGFIGNFEGSHIEGCYANHIDTVRGEEYAGGFIGRMVPGDVAKAADNTSLIDDLIKIDGGLLSALQTMVPSVKNSYAKCVPCGGTVLAYGTDRTTTPDTVTNPVGVAGGFVGLNAGGQIWGNYDEARTTWQQVDGVWTEVTLHTATVENRADKTADHSGNAADHVNEVYGTGQSCDILQLLQVDATQYAGGYSGYTKAADLAALGDIQLLDGLVDLSNLLAVGQVVVPTQRNTGITGPLRNVTQAQMAYLDGQNIAGMADFSKYYGYTVGHADTQVSGGYCGVMTTGVMENCIAYDLIAAEAVQQAGGFVGAMLTGGVAQADLESSLLGGLLNGVTSVTEQLLGVVNAIVPVIKTSGVYGCWSGSQITAHNGSAGGFAGTVRGGQIWGEDGSRPASPVWGTADDADPGTGDTPAAASLDGEQPVKTWEALSNRCFTKNLRSVTAAGTTGDAGGFAGYMGAASVASLGGLGLLRELVALPANFLSLLSATVPTVYYADTAAVDSWGFTVNSETGRSGGGFAGFLQGAQVGSKEHPGITDSGDTTGNSENITVTGLRSVRAGDYAGGFFGYADAADTLSISGTDEAGGSEQFTLLQLLTIGNVSAIELAKSYIYNSRVDGISGGYQVQSTNAYAWQTAEWNENEDKAACAGGFGGLLQAGVVRYCTAENLSQVSGKNYAGGFVARMGKSSILKANDVATTSELGILGDLVQLSAGVGDVFGSHIEDSTLTGTSEGYAVLAQGGSHEIAGGFVGYADVCRIKNCKAENLRLVMSDEIAGGFMGAMSDAMLLSLNVGLLQRLLAGVTVGVDLIKANRSKIENATVTGLDDWDGYDVYGGGATETSAANTNMGYAGAFLGLNFGSTVTGSKAVYADTVKGTAGSVNPYVGTEENTALLLNLELDVLLELIDLDGWLSKSEIENSTFQTRTGNTEKPSGVDPDSKEGETPIGSLSTPYYVAPNEVDLMVQQVTHTLTVTKELAYAENAVPNLSDLDYSYLIEVRDADHTLVGSAMLHPGESLVLDNPAEGQYTVTEVAASVLPGNITPAGPQTVTITGTQSQTVTLVNTVRPLVQPDPGDSGGETGGVYGGRFVVNHIPTDGETPDVMDNPCEMLHQVPDDTPLSQGAA